MRIFGNSFHAKFSSDKAKFRRRAVLPVTGHPSRNFNGRTPSGNRPKCGKDAAHTERLQKQYEGNFAEKTCAYSMGTCS